MEPANKNKIALITLKICVSGTLLYGIFKKTGIQNILTSFAAINILSFIFASLLYVFATYLSSIRWGMFLDKKYPLKKLFSLYFIGSFFNNLLPSIVGGDAVKVYYLYKDTKKGSSSFGSVFMDRYIGFFALLSIGMISTSLAFDELKKINLYWVMPVLFISFTGISLIFFVGKVGRRIPALAKFYDYFYAYISQKTIIVNTFILSIIIQLCGIMAVYLLSIGIGENPSFIALFVFVPIIITVSMIPISISGLGVREGAFVILLGLAGISPQAATSISLLWFLSTAFASLIGLVEFFRYKKFQS